MKRGNVSSTRRKMKRRPRMGGKSKYYVNPLCRRQNRSLNYRMLKNLFNNQQMVKVVLMGSRAFNGKAA